MQYQSFPVSYDIKFEDPPIYPSELAGRGAAHGLLVGAVIRSPEALAIQWASVDGETTDQLPLGEVIEATALLIQSCYDDIEPGDPRKEVFRTALVGLGKIK
jgi:hypothetical protein